MKLFISYTLLVLVMLFWAANFYAVKIALDFYAPLAIASWRFAFGVLTLLMILGVRNGRQLFKMKFSKAEWWYIFLLAFFGIFLTIYFFNAGLQTTSPINGALIISTTPAITGILSVFLLKQKLVWKQWLAIVLSFVGVLLILIKGDVSMLLAFQFERGDIYILLMALVFSLSQIIVKKYLAHVDSLTMIAIASAMSLVLFLLFSFPDLAATAVPIDSGFWWSILYMGVLGSGFTYVAFYYCVVKLGATVSSLSMNLIPFFAVILAYILGDQVLGVQLIGGLMTITGLVSFKLASK